MKHGDKLSQLSRNPMKRAILLKQLTTHLLEHERIHTTITRAKSLRKVMDKIITLGKRNTMESKLRVFEHVYVIINDNQFSHFKIYFSFTFNF